MRLHSGLACRSFRQRQSPDKLMVSMKFAIARLGALICVCLGSGVGSGDAAPPGQVVIVPPNAVATVATAGYCFARVRGLDPGRLPPSYLVLKVGITVSYRNPGTKGLIIPLERKRAVYTSFNPAEMKALKEGPNLFEPTLKVMLDLPPEVSPDSPISPKNDVFAVIPAGGEMVPPLLEEVTIPVTPKGLFKQSSDLRRHRVYIELRFLHRDMSAVLGSDLSDRWSRFGVPWTGILTTNKVTVDVPASPEASGPCVDTFISAHPAVSMDNK